MHNAIITLSRCDASYWKCHTRGSEFVSEPGEIIKRTREEEPTLGSRVEVLGEREKETEALFWTPVARVTALCVITQTSAALQCRCLLHGLMALLCLNSLLWG